MEEGLQSLLGLDVEQVVGTSHDKLYKRVVQLDETLLVDWWIRDVVVVIDDIVEADLQEIVVQPTVDGRFYLAEFLRGLCSAQSLHEVGLACKPVAYEGFVCIKCVGQLECVAHAIEGFSEDVVRVEPAELFLEAGFRAKVGAVELQRGLLAHFFCRFEGHREGCADSISFAYICVTSHESICVDAFRQGLRPFHTFFCPQ